MIITIGIIGKTFVNVRIKYTGTSVAFPGMKKGKNTAKSNIISAMLRIKNPFAHSFWAYSQASFDLMEEAVRYPTK